MTIALVMLAALAGFAAVVRAASGDGASEPPKRPTLLDDGQRDMLRDPGLSDEIEATAWLLASLGHKVVYSETWPSGRARIGVNVVGAMVYVWLWRDDRGRLRRRIEGSPLWARDCVARCL